MLTRLGEDGHRREFFSALLRRTPVMQIHAARSANRANRTHRDGGTTAETGRANYAELCNRDETWTRRVGGNRCECRETGRKISVEALFPDSPTGHRNEPRLRGE